MAEGNEETGTEPTPAPEPAPEPEIPLEDLEPVPPNLSPVDQGVAYGQIESALLYNDSTVYFASFTEASFESADMKYATNADVGQNSNGTVGPNAVYMNRDVFVYTGDTHRSLDGNNMSGLFVLEELTTIEPDNAQHNVTAYDRNFIRENENTSLYTWSE